MYERDPEACWKLLKDLKDDSNATDPSNSISAEEWVQHFSDLFEIKPNFSNKQEQFQSYLDFMLDLKTFLN